MFINCKLSDLLYVWQSQSTYSAYGGLDLNPQPCDAALRCIPQCYHRCPIVPDHICLNGMTLQTVIFAFNAIIGWVNDVILLAICLIVIACCMQMQ